MTEFIRARSDEQKALRMAEIKGVASRQFATRPYHEITLTTIAEELGWSRANLYKYVTTKEEIFLLLAGDGYTAYFQDLLAALPEDCGYSVDVLAKVWAGIANAHQEYFRLGDILSTIIETNVTVERLAAFKQGYYAYVDRMTERLPRIIAIEPANVDLLVLTIYYHAVGYASGCWHNPLIAEALERIGRPRHVPPFRDEMRDFIHMCLTHYTS